VKHTELRDAISQLSLARKNCKEVETNSQEQIKSSQLDTAGTEVKSLELKDDTLEQRDESKEDIKFECDLSQLDKAGESNSHPDKVDFRNAIEGNREGNKTQITDIREPARIDSEEVLPLTTVSLKEKDDTDFILSEIQTERTEDPEIKDLNINDAILNFPVENNSEKEVEPSLVKLVQDNIETELQIGEVANIHVEDYTEASSSLVRSEAADANVGADLGSNNLRKLTDETKLICDTNIPEVDEGLIHSEEISSSDTNSPVKIDLKNNFLKLAKQVNLFDVPKTKSDTDLEMFEKNLFTNANGDHADKEAATAEEVRIVKMVEDLDKNDKIVRIIEELDKTKSLTKRRKSGEAPGPDKKTSPSKPLEAIPITNALQGLQALLKMSKMSDSSSTSSKSSAPSGPENKSGRSRNLSGTSSKSTKSRHGDQHEVTSRRHSGSNDRNDTNEHKSRKSDSKSRQGNHKDSKSRHSDPPLLTKINRSALVRDCQVETHSKSLVEEQNSKKTVVEDLQAVSHSKSGYHYESGRSRNKFQSFQMKDIRKRLLPVPSSSNTISSRAAEVARRVKEDGEEVKVLSYRVVKPKIDESQDHERIIRKVENENPIQKPVKIKSEAKRKVTATGEGVKEKVVRKVTEVEKSEQVNNVEKVLIEGSDRTKDKTGHSSGTLSLFQKSIVSIVKVQTQENNDESKVAPERRKSLDLIKEELERVTSKVNDIKKKPVSREISSDDDMKVLMKDVQNMEKEVEEISEEADDDRKSKSKKKKSKDDRKKKKSKYTGDIAIDARIAKKIISRIISSDMGKTFNEVIKQEVGETESTIEKLREDLRKKSSQEDKSKKKRKKDKKKEGKDKKKKKKDKHGDEENPNDLCEDRKKKKKSKERSETRTLHNDTEVDQSTGQIEERRDERLTSAINEDNKRDRSADFKKSKKRKSSSPVRFYDQVPDIKASDSCKEPEDSEGRKHKKIKSDERKDNHKKKKSKKKHKRDKENQEKENSSHPVGNNIGANQVPAFMESKTEVQEERIVRKRSPTPSKDFDLVLGIADDDLLDDETELNETKRSVEPSDTMTETEVDTTIDENDCTNDETDVSTCVIDAALEDIPVRESPANEEAKDMEDTTRSNTNSGATSSANSEDDQSDDEDNLRALLLSQLSKTRCGPKSKSKRRSSDHTKVPNSKITKITWSTPPPEPVEVSSTTPPVPPTSTPAYPPIGSLPVYAYAYSRTFITPAEKLLYFPNLYNRIIVPLDLDSDSDSDCHSDCDSYWGEKRTSQWVSERMSHSQVYSESDPRFSQANLNLMMRQARDSSSPAPI